MTTVDDTAKVRSDDRNDARRTGDEVTAAEDSTDESRGQTGDRGDAMSRGERITIALLATATIGLVLAGLLLWHQVQSNAYRDQERQVALTLARQQATTLTTVNPNNVNHQMRWLLEHSTGDFRRQFHAASPTFGKVIADGKVHSQGTVAEAGVVSLSPDQAEVLVALNSTVRNTGTNKEELRRYRLRVELEKEADQWLVSNMRFVP